MVGAIRAHKSNASPSVCETWLNWRMRMILNARPQWAGAIQRGILSVPAAYGIGTVSTTAGSNIVTGTSTAWPVSDVVNSTIPNAVTQTGLQTVTPADMTGIAPDTWLYVDAAGTNPEVVYVIDTNQNNFTAKFNYRHNAAATITCSSFAGRTLRTGFQKPNFLITAVVSTTSLLIEIPWGGTALTSTTYTILKNLYTFAPDLKQLMSVVDPLQGLSLTINYPLTMQNRADPQRSGVDFPQYVVSHSINQSGTALFELWPSPTTARQMYFEYYQQPKDMKAPGDQPPPYIDGQVLVAGALADAYKTRIGVDDQYFDLNVSQMWETRFAESLQALMQADQNLFSQQYTWNTGNWGYPRGSNFEQSHDLDSFFGNF